MSPIIIDPPITPLSPPDEIEARRRSYMQHDHDDAAIATI